jgi:hypothetical protein
MVGLPAVPLDRGVAVVAPVLAWVIESLYSPGCGRIEAYVNRRAGYNTTDGESVKGSFQGTSAGNGDFKIGGRRDPSRFFGSRLSADTPLALLWPTPPPLRC